MKNDAILGKLLSMKLIPNVTDALQEKLNLPEGHRSIGVFTSDCDDVAYIAMDEATKKVNVVGVYGETFYAGAANATGLLAGEVVCIISGPTPAEVHSGLQVVTDVFEAANAPRFVSCNDDDTIAYMAHTISKTGSYLSNIAEIPEGQAIAYLIAYPGEFFYALDAAMKAADVELCYYIEPPSPTNCGGAFLTGSQSACITAAEAFGNAVQYVADNPLKI
ncbi:ethanolamine utilization microcompartment protein EutL [Maledivibacter halophilus]|uniref:Ethanolamine utilization protein EutL n=1 Tax=Maledivibacter halophilus TaxID=36842 RepID=A0A1T5MJZ3_9FIRM|nr:ethanolamine utilization microcompartment protein EutL [Maledivibacter halophilus]SKC88541.1 ethanolamine utilization protein EutL [Maledivibacter halophilus]